MKHHLVEGTVNHGHDVGDGEGISVEEHQEVVRVGGGADLGCHEIELSACGPSASITRSNLWAGSPGTSSRLATTR
jgi:hypothetical protein